MYFFLKYEPRLRLLQGFKVLPHFSSNLFFYSSKKTADCSWLPKYVLFLSLQTSQGERW